MLAPVRAVCDGVAGSVQVFLTAMVMPAAARGTTRFRALFSATSLLKIFVLSPASLKPIPLGFALVSVKNHPRKQKKGKGDKKLTFVMIPRPLVRSGMPALAVMLAQPFALPPNLIYSDRLKG